MTNSSNEVESTANRGRITAAEIRQQPDLWPLTIATVAAAGCEKLVSNRKAIVCGAGTSAYAGSVVAQGWDGALAIATTDLLVSTSQEIIGRLPGFDRNGVLVSLARSGDSPESLGVITRFRHMFPHVVHLAITCNAHGQLARSEGVTAIVLDPRTNDRGLAMTSSFSNLALAGLALTDPGRVAAGLPRIIDTVSRSYPALQLLARQLASSSISRFMVLAPPAMLPLAHEACLKVLEMTAGRVATMPETFLGLRHGPMSFLRPDSLIVCVLSSDKAKRLYELDLIRELRAKELGKIVILGEYEDTLHLGHATLPAMAPDLPDFLRTPFEIVFLQLLAYELSLAFNLDPDNPSPSGVITRVVQEFQLHLDGSN